MIKLSKLISSLYCYLFVAPYVYVCVSNSPTDRKFKMNRIERNNNLLSLHLIFSHFPRSFSASFHWNQPQLHILLPHSSSSIVTSSLSLDFTIVYYAVHFYVLWSKLWGFVNRILIPFHWVQDWYSPAVEGLSEHPSADYITTLFATTFNNLPCFVIIPKIDNGSEVIQVKIHVNQHLDGQWD